MEGTTREGEDFVILLEVWWFVSACATLFSYIKEGRPLNSVYRSAFTYYIHRRSLNGIHKLSSPSPIMLQNSHWIWEKEKKTPPRSFTKKGREMKISPDPSFSIILSSRSLLPEWDAFSISNILFTNDQAKRVCDCTGHLWGGTGPWYAHISGLNSVAKLQGPRERRRALFLSRYIWYMEQTIAKSLPERKFLFLPLI